MHSIVVRTKLQSLIIKELIDRGIICKPYHVIRIFWGDEPPVIDSYTQILFNDASAVTVISRHVSGFFRIFRCLLFSILQCKMRNHEIYSANIDRYPFAIALKMVPGFQVNTFDDGSANIIHSSIFFSETPSEKPGLEGWSARFLFPSGPANFVRKRIKRHFTIYPGFRNIADSNKIYPTLIQWKYLLDKEDINLLPRNVAKILLGGVYNEMSKAFNFSISDRCLREIIEWADLYIPHPRQKEEIEVPAVVSKYTAETLISYYSKNRPITVAHFHSSAAIPFYDDPHVHLVDLTIEHLSEVTRE